MIRLYVYSVHEGKTLEFWEYQTDHLNNTIWKNALSLVKEHTYYRDMDTAVFIRINGKLVATLRTIYDALVERRVLVIERETDENRIIL